MKDERKEMGRQYNYFIGPFEEKELVKYLQSEGYIYISPQKYIIDDKVCWSWENNKKGDSKSYLYKEEWGKLNNNCDRLSDLINQSPIIEQIHCKVNKNNRMVRGRLYIDSSYLKENDYYNVVCKNYNNIIRYIKKYILYNEYTFSNGMTLYWPISNEAISLVEAGCLIDF